MRIQEQLEKIAEKMCDEYCKYPEEYNSRTDDVDKNMELLGDEICVNCPLYKAL